MKCYTWHHGRLTSGIEIERNKSLGVIVSLGSKGHGGGRVHEKVELYRKNPPEIENSYIYNAQPLKITSNYYMLAKPDSIDDSRVLVRIKTRWIYARGSHGGWETIAGASKNLMIGYGAHGTSIQRAATWCEGLVLFTPGDAVCIIPSGGYRVEQYALFCNESGIHHATFGDYEKRHLNSRQL